MKVTIRRTHAFLELKVNEIETTIFKSDLLEINEVIENLKDVIEELELFKEEKQ